MSTHKYSTGRSRRLLRDRDGGRVGLTDHAIHRWQTRTPHECSVSIREAWARGEWINHPAVARGEDHETPPDDVRVFRYGQRWGVVFLVVAASGPWEPTQPADRVVCTTCAIRTFDHGPTRAYLHSHGPHYHPDSSETGGADA